MESASCRPAGELADLFELWASSQCNIWTFGQCDKKKCKKEKALQLTYHSAFYKKSSAISQLLMFNLCKELLVYSSLYRLSIQFVSCSFCIIFHAQPPLVILFNKKQNKKVHPYTSQQVQCSQDATQHSSFFKYKELSLYKEVLVWIHLTT